MNGESAGETGIGSNFKTISILLAAAVLTLGYLGLVAAQNAAAYLSQQPELRDLQLAAELQPWDAEYQYRLGRYFSLEAQRADLAAEYFRRAVELNPHSGNYWLDLAAAYNVLRDPVQQEHAIENGVAADPTSPKIAWQAANFYLERGDKDMSLAEFRVVLASDLSLSLPALRQCERFVDTDTIIRNVMPSDPQPYYVLLDELMLRKQTADAEKAWEHLLGLRRSLERPRVIAFTSYLIAEHEVEAARLVWHQAAALANLQAYQPSTENLVINGDFAAQVLNGGFGWVHQATPNVTLELDPTQTHSGNQSLLITFEGPGIDDAGIRQLIPVQPGTRYEFSANFKAENINGAGGPRIAIQDAYSGSSLFASDNLKGADFWKSIGGSFTTAPDTNLISIRIQRVPAGSPIRGRLWIDGVKLRPQEEINAR